MRASGPVGSGTEKPQSMGDKGNREDRGRRDCERESRTVMEIEMESQFYGIRGRTVGEEQWG